MSKRCRSSPPQMVGDPVCLNFADWKAEQTAAENVERAGDPVYDPSIEILPYHSWYTLDHEKLQNTVLRMYRHLSQPVKDCQVKDPEIADLLKHLDQATNIPHPKRFSIAVVGNQGVGKSTTINALLNRDLVDASASSRACTSFATIIQYKAGAKDDTTVSDLKVIFYGVSEIRDFIEENIRRYAEVYTSENVDVANAMFEVEDGESDIASEVSDKGDSADEMSDSDFSDFSDRPKAKKTKQKEVSKIEQRSADTAEQFFRIIFNAHQDISKESELQRWLDEPGLEDGRFLEHCVQAANEHLKQIYAEEGGHVDYNDVKDSDLQRVRDHATIMWPLVKSVTISTGSVLLRNGVQFMDLPGYGDLNQTRTAIVNEYRRKADFEMVVAKSDLYLSKTDEDRFLHRAVRQHGLRTFFLCSTKQMQSCLETPRKQVLGMLKKDSEEPFVTIYRHLCSTVHLKDEARRTVQQYERYLIREAQMADGKRECDRIRSKMHRKGIRVFAVSSARYFDWLDPSSLEDKLFDPQATAIPDLRRALLMLPAEASYKDLTYHIFETVTDVEDKVSRILKKFSNDIDVAELRRHMLENLPMLCSELRELSVTAPDSHLSEAWSDVAKRNVASSMGKQIMSYEPKEDTAYHTFWLMLRNNGIATHGKCKDKNLNNELMQTYKDRIKQWKHKASSKETNIKQSLRTPVQAMLTELLRRLEAASSDPELKLKVNQSLEKLTRRIRVVQNTLAEQLQAATNENYRRFTTEEDIKCPVAVEMKTAYARINLIRMHERPNHRRGIYKDQRNELVRTVTESNNGMKPLVDAMSVQVKQHQCSLWQTAGEAFITAVLVHFKEFAQALEELLENDTYMLEEHKVIREQLGKELVGFSKDLALIKGQFRGPENGRVAKKVRTMVVKEEVPA